MFYSPNKNKLQLFFASHVIFFPMRREWEEKLNHCNNYSKYVSVQLVTVLDTSIKNILAFYFERLNIEIMKISVFSH